MISVMMNVINTIASAVTVFNFIINLLKKFKQK